VTSSCVACGREGQTCCSGSICADATLVCQTAGLGGTSTCTTCGGTGQPCCANNTCTAGGTCSRRLGTCS
jgi:hypothetical protein